MRFIYFLLYIFIYYANKWLINWLIIKTTASIPNKFCSDKDHQMPFVVCPHTRITNPRWRTAAILEKSKNSHFDEIWRDDAVQPSWASRPLKICNFKNPRWRRPPSWKVEKRNIAAAVWPILTKFGTMMHFEPLDVPTEDDGDVRFLTGSRNMAV